MKKILLLLLTGISLSLLGCGNSAEQKVAQEKALKEAEKAERIKLLKQQQARSLNIWKDIKFGMTRKEVLQTDVFKNLEDTPEDFDFLLSGYLNIHLGVRTKELGKFCLKFGEKKGRLYSIEFHSNKYVTADHIDDMENDCHNIIKIMETGFGEELKWQRTNVGVLDFNEGEEISLMNEYFGQVLIWVNMGEIYEGSEYYYRITAFCEGYSI